MDLQCFLQRSNLPLDYCLKTFLTAMQNLGHGPGNQQMVREVSLHIGWTHHLQHCTLGFVVLFEHCQEFMQSGNLAIQQAIWYRILQNRLEQRKQPPVLTCHRVMVGDVG